MSSFNHACFLCFHNLHQLKLSDQICAFDCPNCGSLRILSMSSTFAQNWGIYVGQLYCHPASPLVGQNIVQRCTTHKGTGALTPCPMSPYCCSESTSYPEVQREQLQETTRSQICILDRCKRDSHRPILNTENAAAFTANWGWVSWWRICPRVGWCGIVLASPRQVSSDTHRQFAGQGTTST